MAPTRRERRPPYLVNAFRSGPLRLGRSRPVQPEDLVACGCCTYDEIMRQNLDPTLIVLEEAMAEQMIEAWEARTGVVQGRARQLVAQGAIRTLDDVDRFVASLSDELGNGVADDVAAAMTEGLTAAYTIGRNAVFKPLPAEVVINVTDRAAQEWLSEHHVYWVRTNYDRRISGAIADGVRTKVVEQGMSPAVVGRALQDTLGHELGVKGSETYWRGVAQNASTSAVNFGRVASFEQAGVTSTRAVNPKDRDTSKVCNYLHGAVWKTQHAIDQRNGMMAATTPEAVKLVHRWTTIQELRKVGGPIGGASADTDALAKAGIVVPPFHFHCRTFMVANEFGAIQPFML